LRSHFLIISTFYDILIIFNVMLRIATLSLLLVSSVSYLPLSPICLNVNPYRSLPVSRRAKSESVRFTSVLFERTKEKNIEDKDFTEMQSLASKAPPPASFYQLNIAAQEAATLAIARGERLLEVEFPPLPSEVLEMDDVSAYDVAKANLRLAIDFAKIFAQRGEKVRG